MSSAMDLQAKYIKKQAAKKHLTKKNSVYGTEENIVSQRGR